MNLGRAARRLGRVVVHNWPLKLAAAVLATLLYAGFVASQDDSTFPGRIPVQPANQAPDTVVTNQLHDVERIRYFAPGLPALRAEDFHATVNLANLTPDGSTVNVRPDVTAPPGVAIIEVFPATIPVTYDRKSTRSVKVTVNEAEPPAGIKVGDLVVEPAEVVISGASAAVNRVATMQVTVSIDASGINIDRDLQPEPLDASGKTVNGIEVSPTLVHVTLDVFTNLQNRTLPVNPVVTGTPAAGFRIAAVSVDPSTVTVAGDLDQLQGLVAADTAPVVVSGATRDVAADVALALPSGVESIASEAVRVTVRIEAVTETRTFTAGIRLDGRDPALEYEPADTQVLLTLFGSTADLDRLGASPIVIGIIVAGLEPGTHEVAVVPSVPSAVTVAAISPETVTVIVTARPTPTPAPSASGEAAAPTPTPAP